MALAYVACLLVVLQVVSANHIPVTESLPTETTSDYLYNDNFTETWSPSESADSTDDSTFSEVAQTATPGPVNANMTTTLGPLNNSMTTTEDNEIVVTYVYVTRTDDPSTTVEPTITPKPIENLAAIMSQPGIMILLPLLVRLVPLWSWR